MMNDITPKPAPLTDAEINRLAQLAGTRERGRQVLVEFAAVMWPRLRGSHATRFSRLCDLAIYFAWFAEEVCYESGESTHDLPAEHPIDAWLSGQLDNLTW